jgi:ABC-type multidrug transport system fused ATPase/permease subunit
VPRIELVGVTYRYPESVRPALSDLSLVLPAGARTALVGRSGAGKSTLVSLLLRFMDPTSGRIAVNGLPITELPVEIWRENVALVPQQPYLFHGSVHENISLACPAATRADVERAAELAGAAEFIARLPRGYDTQIGERGSRLSGGEAQRLAIARAFLKDAPLLILDEPTSNLDPTSEAFIRAALERLMHERTVLVVAHRLNTIYTADRIAVLEHGRLVEAGSHAELLERGGLYARLVGADRRVPVS